MACVNIITETGGLLLITESSDEIVTENSVCPEPPDLGQKDKVFVGTIFGGWNDPQDPRVGGL